MRPIDKQGNCPACDKSWAGGDVFETLRNMSVFSYMDDDELKLVTNSYGWHTDAPTKFSKVVVYQRNDDIFFACPDMRCGHVFNSKTGEEYESLFDLNLKRNKHTEGATLFIETSKEKDNIEKILENFPNAKIYDSPEEFIDKALEGSPFFTDEELEKQFQTLIDKHVSERVLNKEEKYAKSEHDMLLEMGLKTIETSTETQMKKVEVEHDINTQAAKEFKERIKESENYVSKPTGNFSKLSNLLRKG